LTRSVVKPAPVASRFGLRSIDTLSKEAREKQKKVEPPTISQAARVVGLTRLISMPCWFIWVRSRAFAAPETPAWHD